MIQSLVNEMYRLFFLAADLIGEDLPPVQTPAADTHATNYASTPPVEAAAAPGGLFGGGFGLIAVYVIIFGGIWFFMMRPHRRREKKLKELQSGIRTGDNVVTNGGMFGKVTDVGTDCFVVEMGISGRTVKIPILKTDVLGVREPVLTPPPKEVE